MDFKYWRNLVLRSGTQLGDVDPGWLQHQFESGRSPAAVGQDIRNGLAPRNATPRTTWQWRVKTIMAILLTIFLASLVGYFGSQHLGEPVPEVKRDIIVHWEFFAPNVAVGEVTNLSDQTLRDVCLTLPAAYDEREGSIVSTRNGLAISMPERFTLRPGEKITFKFMLQGITSSAVPEIFPPLPGHGIGLL
ncbi:MAG: hypothetical protein JST51_12825 [Armatimonadetes bacterium]|nr:hypothetical protein [Armatimonadota bacterium]